MGEILYSDKNVQEFMKHFKILDVCFFTSTQDLVGYIKIQVEKEIKVIV